MPHVKRVTKDEKNPEKKVHKNPDSQILHEPAAFLFAVIRIVFRRKLARLITKIYSYTV